MRQTVVRASATMGFAALGAAMVAACACGDISGSDTGGGGPDAGKGDGGHPPRCIPSENVDAVDDACGVFVSSSLGDDGNAGTKEKPLKSIGVALTKGRPVYACGEGFAESVSIAESATLYGALDCTTGWVYAAGKKTLLTADPDAIPLSIGNATTITDVLDFAVTSANATQSSGSSVAVLVAQATASFTRCDLVAGNGRDGAVGAPHMSAAQAGSVGLPGNAACAASIVVPGDSVTNSCGNGDSISGAGGVGLTNSGGAGSPGLPAGAANGGAGAGAGMCTDGTKGDDGGSGTAGPGATGIGTIAASGYTGASGSDGGPGLVAQSGGGGGGAKGETVASVCPMGKGGGASGASGGSGGCGGLGGKGGAFGGSSVALMSIGATLSFANVTLKAGNGGVGGDGGNGQAGGDGGKGGTGGLGTGALKPGCAGGPGGKGGSGGRGGGAAGGHALAIAATGKAPPASGWTATKGAAGAGGKGDTMNGNAGDGATGIAADCWDFAANAACK